MRKFLIICLLASSFMYFLFRVNERQERLAIENATATAVLAPQNPENEKNKAKGVTGNPNVSLLEKINETSSDKTEFHTLTSTALMTLPTVNDMSKLSNEEAHHLSPKTFEKAQILGVIVDRVKFNPSLEPEAMIFYEKCSLKKQLIISVRGRCLAQLRALAKKRDAQLDLSQYPEDLKRLSEFIP